MSTEPVKPKLVKYVSSLEMTSGSDGACNVVFAVGAGGPVPVGGALEDALQAASVEMRISKRRHFETWHGRAIMVCLSVRHQRETRAHPGRTNFDLGSEGDASATHSTGCPQP